MGQPWVYGEVTIVRWGFETTDNQRAPPCFSHLKKGLLKDSFQASKAGWWLNPSEKYESVGMVKFQLTMGK
jgi:hypothetical protein